MSKKEFFQTTKPVTASIGEQMIQLAPKEFSSGNLGFSYNGKMTLNVGNTPVAMQCNINVAALAVWGAFAERNYWSCLRTC